MQKSTYTMDTLKESLAPKTFSKISYAAIIIWFVINVIFFGIFAEVENTESRYDFSRGGVKSENIDLVRGECFEKYEKQNNKYGVFANVFGRFANAMSRLANVLLVTSPTPNI